MPHIAATPHITVTHSRIINILILIVKWRATENCAWLRAISDKLGREPYLIVLVRTSVRQTHLMRPALTLIMSLATSRPRIEVSGASSAEKKGACRHPSRFPLECIKTLELELERNDTSTFPTPHTSPHLPTSCAEGPRRAVGSGTSTSTY